MALAFQQRATAARILSISVTVRRSPAPTASRGVSDSSAASDGPPAGDFFFDLSISAASASRSRSSGCFGGSFLGGSFFGGSFSGSFFGSAGGGSFFGSGSFFSSAFGGSGGFSAGGSGLISGSGFGFGAAAGTLVRSASSALSIS
jgi:hypothetical protein